MLDQAALAPRLGAGDRAGGEQVAGPDVGAVDGRVGELLRERPVQPAGVRAGDHLAVELDLERDVERPVAGGLAGSRAAAGPARGPGTRNGSSAASGTTQGEIEVANDFPRNGPSGWYSQRWMSRALQSLTSTKPNTWSRRLGGRDARAEGVAGAGDERRARARCRAAASARSGRALGRELPVRAADRRAGDHDRARAAVVADGQVAPVGQQRVGRRGGTDGRGSWRARATSRSRRSRRSRPGDAAPGRRAGWSRRPWSRPRAPSRAAHPRQADRGRAAG